MFPISVIIFFVAFVGLIILLSRKANSLDSLEESHVDSVKIRTGLNSFIKRTYGKTILWATKNGWRVMHGIENKIKEGKNKIEDFMVKKHEENMKKTKKSKAKHLLDLRKKLNEDNKLDIESE